MLRRRLFTIVRHGAQQIRQNSTTPDLAAIRTDLRNLGSGSVHLNVARFEGIALLTLDNPSRHNALSGKMMAELADHVDTLSRITASPTSDLVGLILTGVPHKSFCAGLDLSVAKDHILTPSSGSAMSALMQDTLTRLLLLPLISISAIEGAALGGGAELTTATDFRLMTTKSKVRFVQTKMAVVTGWGGASRLVSLVGRTRALRLLAGAETLDAETALGWEYAGWVSDAGQSVERARQVLDGMVVYEDDKERRRKSITAVRGMKRIVSVAFEEGIAAERVREVERNLFFGMWGGDENRQAVGGIGKK